MDRILLKAYEEQIAQQARFVLRATRDARSALNALYELEQQPRQDLQAKQEAMDLFWYCAQGVVTYSGNIAKVLWGSAGKRAQARAPLRESLLVPTTSPLKALRLRNHFEHFDERIDCWWAKSANHDYADRNIRDISHYNFAEIDTFRNFNPDTAELFFWGDRINFSELVLEVRRILSRVERQLARTRYRF